MAVSKETKQWFVVYTRARTEKKVFEALMKEQIEAYLPLVKKMRQWSDRKKMVEEPLFRSYVFVHISPREYFQTLNVFGVARFVTFEGKAVPIPENQMKAIRLFVEDPMEEEQLSTVIAEGQPVRVKSGPMEGLIGTMIKYQNKFRLIIQIDAIGQMINVNIARSRIEAIDSKSLKA